MTILTILPTVYLWENVGFGNTILETIKAGQDLDSGWLTPTRLVVSEKCEAGITTLIAWIRAHPADWLFRTVEDAYQRVKQLAELKDATDE